MPNEDSEDLTWHACERHGRFVRGMVCVYERQGSPHATTRLPATFHASLSLEDGGGEENHGAHNGLQHLLFQSTITTDNYMALG